ncbi:MAG: hypothetical protein JWP28_2193, partial [Phenylobacterium sp.]|nr:hypothetical protein [Phenylobacterium sp.]
MSYERPMIPFNRPTRVPEELELVSQ